MKFEKDGSILGFDFGVKQIGVATGHTLTQMASPLTVIRAQEGIPAWDAFSLLIEQWQPIAFVVGLPPKSAKWGDEMQCRAQKFGRRIKERYQCPLFFEDEHLTTFEAYQTLGEHQKRIKKHQVDALAAALILESWFRKTGYESD